MRKKISNEIFKGINDKIKESKTGELLTSEHILKLLENEREKNKLGVFGFIFGSTKYTSIYIAGAIAILLSGFGIVATFKEMDYKIIWEMITPTITMCIGYIFGKFKD